MAKKIEYHGQGVGIFGLTFIVLLTLKLAEIGQVATLSWWWVTAPLWGPVALFLCVIAVLLIIGGSMWLVGKALGQ